MTWLRIHDREVGKLYLDACDSAQNAEGYRSIGRSQTLFEWELDMSTVFTYTTFGAVLGLQKKRSE